VAEGSSVSNPDPLDAEHLLDTTVWSKSRSRPELVKWFNEAIAADFVLVCDIVELEVLRPSS
jgi:predicted nucleic acid-binding protein